MIKKLGYLVFIPFCAFSVSIVPIENTQVEKHQNGVAEDGKIIYKPLKSSIIKVQEKVVVVLNKVIDVSNKVIDVSNKVIDVTPKKINNNTQPK